MRALTVAIVVMMVCGGTTAWSPWKTLQERIRHVIVLMEENRSFDHLLGWFANVNGLTGAEYNLEDSRNKSSRRIYVSRNATPVVPCDPDHSTFMTTLKIFGWDALVQQNRTMPTMGNFFDAERTLHKHANGCRTMDMFDPSRLPVMEALVKNFAVFDRFFASVPGPTWPNRLYFLSGTSAGLTETGPWYQDKMGSLFPQRTVFDQVAEGGGQWRVYYNDTPWELFVASIAHHPESVRPLTEFFADAERGTLPDFAFINPRAGVNLTLGVGSNDHHPDHDISLGEEYYKTIYEALRASPQWNETLLVITYDEHGGYYDHVAPPAGVPPPDDEPSYPDPNIRFDRLGMRVPTLLVSPWVPAGTVLHAPPPSQRPAPNSEYELTSIVETARRALSVLQNSTPLTKRSAWAATFEDVLMRLAAPRTDCPMHLPDPIPPARAPEDEAALPVNALQRDILEMHGGLHGMDKRASHHHIRTQGDVGSWLQAQFHRHVRTTNEWMRSKANVSVAVGVFPRMDLGTLSQAWTVNVGSKVMTINSRLEWPNVYCLDAGGTTVGSRVTVSVCYPSAAPDTNRDTLQQWRLLPDATLRPAWNASLCVTNRYFSGDTGAYLMPCVGNVMQHWSYQGPAAGSSNSGYMYFSDWTTALSVYIRL